MERKLLDGTIAQVVISNFQGSLVHQAERQEMQGIAASWFRNC